MSHYPLVCTDREEQDGFDRVNRLVTGLFAEFLPAWCWGVDPADPFDTSGSDIQTTRAAIRVSRVDCPAIRKA